MKRRILIISLVVILVIALGTYNYLYQDHRDISKEVAEITLTPERLVERFKKDNASDLLNTAIAVSGLVTEVENDVVTLDNKVSCSFTAAHNIKLNDTVVIKGRCLGYDELFEIVKLDQCSVLK